MDTSKTILEHLNDAEDLQAPEKLVLERDPADQSMVWEKIVPAKQAAGKQTTSKRVQAKGGAPMKHGAVEKRVAAK
jgi:hypothetical protein